MSSHDMDARQTQQTPDQPRIRRPWRTPIVIVSEFEDTEKLPNAFDIVTALGVIGPAS